MNWVLMYRRVYLLTLLFLGIPVCQAQDNILRFDHLTVDDGLSQNSIYGIVKDKYGFMWFGTWEGICRYDGYKFTIFRADEENNNALSNNRVNLIFKDSVQNMWIATADFQTICRYNYETEDFTRFPTDSVKKYIRDSLRRAHVYFRTHASNRFYRWEVSSSFPGLKQTNSLTGEQWSYKTDPSNRWGLNDDIITDIYLDNNDILWVGTRNGGINKADTRSKPFVYYSNTTINNGFIVDNVIRAICEDRNGNLWIGTENKGVTKLERRNGLKTRYLHNSKNNNSLINDNVRQIYCDRSGNMWIGTKGGLDRYDPRRNRFYHYSLNSSKPIPNNWVFWIMEDHSGYLWIGTFNGIAKYNRKKDSFLAYDPQKTLKNKAVRVIIEDQHKHLWVATEGGGITLLKRDSAQGFNEKLTPTHFMYSRNNPNSIINNQVLALTEDENGRLWIGTNNGLCRFDTESGIFTRLSVKNGLPDDLIMGILSDTKGHVWISHKKGITRINNKTLDIRNYDLHDGLQGKEFSQNAYFRNKLTGELFFGGVYGINAFFPDSIKDNPFLPNIAFTELQISNAPVEINQKINGKIILTRALSLTKEIVLSYWNKNFSIEFAALHYSNPHGNKYKYYLEGFDDKWITTDASERSATYSNLPAGTYYLKVLASNCDGLWNPNPAVLKIIVLAPWWYTWWAYIGYSIVIGILIFFVYKYVKAKIKFRNQLMIERIKAEKDKELDEIKLQFFTNISHEFRTPLSLIIDPLEKLLSEKAPAEKIQSYYTLMYRNAKRLLNLINQLLDFRKAESGNLQLKISIHDIVQYIKNLMETFELHAQERDIQFTFSSSLTSFQTGFDPDKMDKILFNLISNAFKYTPNGGKIGIELSNEESQTNENENKDFVLIKVRDNGIGIPSDSIDKIFNVFYQVEKNAVHGTGIGLAFTNELVKLHKGKISVESETGKGTCFSLYIPVRHTVDIPVMTEPEKKRQDNIIEVHTFKKESKKQLPLNNFEEDIQLPLVLIVEDNNDVRTYLKGCLSSAYKISEASNSTEGIEKAVESIPDLIISDIMMPGPDGIELCNKLKTDERTSHIPIILLTARQSEESKIEGYETGADAYITKPFSTAILEIRIKNLLDSRRKLRELFSKGTPFEIKKIAINITDEAFINKVLKFLEEHLEETEFDTDILAEKLKMSRSQLYRKIKGLTNLTVHDFIMTFRMNKAAEMLLNGELSISEIAYKVGFTLPTNFTRSFVKQFGKTPSQYIESFKHGN